jgi:hypothetical protein
VLKEPLIFDFFVLEMLVLLLDRQRKEVMKCIAKSCWFLKIR